uniref:Uncharacterized protein n=1 Tax=Odontella aurita TaxID=265563 RepID=A0A7S4J3X4_9STRA
MRPSPLVPGLTALAALSSTAAFISPQNRFAKIDLAGGAPSSLFATSAQDDCGCGGAVVTGKPTDAARMTDPRLAVSQGSFLTLEGDRVTMDSVLGDAKNAGVSLVVFLRSFG